MSHIFLKFVVFLSISANCIVADIAKNKNHISEKFSEKLLQHLIPNDHPIKHNLDKIFETHPDALNNMQSLVQAGFYKIINTKHSKIKVIWHEKLKGYLLKVYTEDVDYPHYLSQITNRVKGSKYIAEFIHEKKYEKHFKVPKKWIYPLPFVRDPTKRQFILVAEEIPLLSKSDNIKAFRNPKLKNEIIHALFTIINELGLKDSLIRTNIPFSKDGKISFIDTEYYHIWPVTFKKLTHVFGENQQEYWKSLIRLNKKKKPKK